MSPVILYTTPTCAPCRAAKRQMDAAGVPYAVVDLTEDAEALEALKSELNAPVVQTPLFRVGDEILTIVDLPRIIAERGEKAA